MIGQRIHQIRLEKGLSMSELAEKAGVAKSYLSAIERGIQANPSIQVMDKLAAVLGTSVQALLSQPQEDGDVPLDPEWIDLAKEVADSGITKEQFREWLEFQRWRLSREGTPDEKGNS